MQLQDRNPPSSTKFKIFGIIAIIVTLGTLPITFSHFTHQNMIYHIFLHIASLTIAIFLSHIAVSAYARDGRRRLLFMALGFSTLAILEILLLLTASGYMDNPTIPTVEVELSHAVLLVMITLFGIGILKVN